MGRWRRGWSRLPTTSQLLVLSSPFLLVHPHTIYTDYTHYLLRVASYSLAKSSPFEPRDTSYTYIPTTQHNPTWSGRTLNSHLGYSHVMVRVTSLIAVWNWPIGMWSGASWGENGTSSADLCPSRRLRPADLYIPSS